ncbi:MAG: hypothetical protein Q8L78_01915 [Coxiellaceae bacterium]|nr:hypothetical protein [Coxiellaceae bacterium]
MTSITIRDHQKLKDALVQAITDYEALSKKKSCCLFSFSTPGDEGRARAEFVSQQLSAIQDPSSNAGKEQLEILLAAIINSEIFTSTVGRLRNLILTHLVAKKGEFCYECGASHEDLDRLDKRSQALRMTISKHAIFANLAQYATYRSTSVQNVEGSGVDLYIHRFNFSRREVLEQAAKDFTQKDSPRFSTASDLQQKINRALSNKKAAEKAGVVELQRYNTRT